MWIEPVYDRSLDDITNRTPKAYLNVSDLNRIEENTKHLAIAVNSNVSFITWTHDTLPTLAQMDRILNNMNLIKARWDIGLQLPEEPINTYEKVNAIERFLEQTYVDWRNENDRYIRCGEGYCGDYDII